MNWQQDPVAGIAERHRQQARARCEAYRARLRHGRLLVSFEVEPRHCAALERLALLPVGERGKEAIAQAIARFLDAAPPIAAIGDALWPAEEKPNGRRRGC